VNPTPTASSVPAGGSATGPRLRSLDALRGFDMFWILGADAVMSGLRGFRDNAATRFLADQFEHKDWQGFAFYDLIFPLFVFIVGVSLVFSLTRTIEREGRAAALRRVFRRGLLLYALGVFYYGGFAKAWPDIRLLGVLQRIALCYFFAGLLFCLFKPRTLAGIGAGLLVGYWFLMSFASFPDVRPTPGGELAVCKETGFTNVAQLNLDSATLLRGVFIKGVNLANYTDQRWLPGFKWDGTWDPEGLLSTLPAIGTCLCGVFAGLLLRNRRQSDGQKLAWLAGAGAVAVAVGWLWGLHFPVIKKIWTSSYVLVAAGYSAWLLAAFYYVIEVRGWERWATPFVWIGMNPITVYLGESLVNYGRVAERLAGGSVRSLLDTVLTPGAGQAVVAILTLGLAILFCRWLYRRQIFLRL
jgi:predicted acyltransferase